MEAGTTGAIQVEWETRGLLRRVQGEVSAIDWERSIAQVGADPRFRRIKYIINDLSECHALRWREAEVQRLSWMLRAGEIAHPSFVRGAFVLPSAGLRAQVETLLQGASLKSNVRLFETLESARNWIHGISLKSSPESKSADLPLSHSDEQAKREVMSSALHPQIRYEIDLIRRSIMAIATGPFDVTLLDAIGETEPILYAQVARVGSWTELIKIEGDANASAEFYAALASAHLPKFENLHGHRALGTAMVISPQTKGYASVEEDYRKAYGQSGSPFEIFPEVELAEAWLESLR
jgi:hypothetical protein